MEIERIVGVRALEDFNEHFRDIEIKRDGLRGDNPQIVVQCYPQLARFGMPRPLAFINVDHSRDPRDLQSAWNLCQTIPVREVHTGQGWVWNIDHVVPVVILRRLNITFTEIMPVPASVNQAHGRGPEKSLGGVLPAASADDIDDDALKKLLDYAIRPSKDGRFLFLNVQQAAKVLGQTPGLKPENYPGLFMVAGQIRELRGLLAPNFLV